MWRSEEVFVLSDLHLAAENGQGLFQADAELAACLSWILSEASDSTVVLAGDVLDYLVLGEGEVAKDAADFKRVGTRTEGIVAHHPEVFSALAALAQSSRHQLVVLGGNHDPELVLPEAQTVFERRMGGILADPLVRWLVHGEALRLQVGPAVVSIEHGDILDNWNRIDHDALRSALSLVSRNLTDTHDYQQPPGSRLILEAVTELRGCFRWVDFLKPENEAVIPLVHHFASAKQKRLMLRLIDDYFSMKLAAIRKFVARKRSAARLYKAKAESETAREKAFIKWVNEVKAKGRLTRANKPRSDKFIETLRQVFALDKFFEIDAPDEVSQDLHPLFENGANLVICGHTHSAKAHRLAGGLYLNTGTWGQLLRLPMSYDSDEMWQQFLEQLGSNTAEGFRRPTFAHLKHIPDKQLTQAALLQWQEPQPLALSAWKSDGPKRAWQQEA